MSEKRQAQPAVPQIVAPQYRRRLTLGGSALPYLMANYNAQRMADAKA